MKSAIELVKLIQKHKLRVFSTSALATLAGMDSVAASQALIRLSKEKLVVRVKRGFWVNQLNHDIHPFEIAPYLRWGWPCYVSLYSALAEHGVIEEISQVIYVVSSALPKNYRTPVGAFHIHHLPPHLLWGYENKKIGQGSYPIAEPEKAFLDLVYLALTPRSPLELPYKRDGKWNLDVNKLTAYAKRFKFEPLRAYLKENRLMK